MVNFSFDSLTASDKIAPPVSVFGSFDLVMCGNVIAITASAMRSDKENIMARGAKDYLSKPINPIELRKKVRQWLG